MRKCILKRHNGGKTQWTIKSFILQRSHIMILNSTRFSGNRAKDLEVGPDRQTDRPIPIYRQTDSYIPPQTTFVVSIIRLLKVTIHFL
jgi:hypothetical protein